MPSDAGGVGPRSADARGDGDPPIPVGGTLIPGMYFLAARTVFGIDLDEGVLFYDLSDEYDELTRGKARETAYIDCRGIDTFYAAAAMGGLPLDECRTLVPHDVSLGEVSFIQQPNGAGFELNAAPGTLAPYTASGDSVTLISVRPLLDPDPVVFISGSYTVVDRFVLASRFDAGAAPAAAPADAAPPPFAPGVRDPRCPASPPSEGDRCDPEPVPLQCEYGGDAWSRGTTFAACVLFPGDGGAFKFDVNRGTTGDGGPNPAACPSDFAAAEGLVDGGLPAFDRGRVQSLRSGVQL